MGKLFFLKAILLAPGAALWAQGVSPACVTTAVPPLIRAEGVAERLGDITLNCSGSPGQQISGNLTIFINAPITNRILSTGALDLLLTVDSGTGPVLTTIPATPAGTNQVAFNGLTFSIGAGGSTIIRISNLRADVSASGSALQDVQANLAFTSSTLLNFTNTRFSVGVVNRGLLASTLLAVIGAQVGSPLPDELSFSNLIAAGTVFSSTRITEGFATSFETRQPNSTQATRILLRYSGLPSDARLFVPNAIAGSTAARPTVAGDFGGTLSGGEYVPGSNTLLLLRVLGTDMNGANGYTVAPPLAGTGILNEVGEVQLNAGNGWAVYEVVDANATAIESAQIPTFLGLPRSVEARAVTISREIYFAPLSTASGPSSTLPVPRFARTAAPSDCTAQRDCTGPFLPRLDVNSPPLEFRIFQGVGFQIRYVTIDNLGGGILYWTARIEYKSGRDWIRIAPAAGFIGPDPGRSAGSLRLDVLPVLPPGIYEATLVIDAGPQAGSRQIPVRMEVVVPATPAPTITGVGNAATFTGPVVPGSLATLKGTNLAGNNPAVTFNGTPARLIFNSSDQINLQVPAVVSGSTAQVVVTVNGVASAASTVNIAPVAPGIFVPGILNQDYTVNSSANPARAGSVVQIYATGLLPPDGSSAAVEAKVQDLVYLTLPYAGPAPGIAGLQQVNLRIPETWPTMTTEVLLCATAAGQRACSPPVRISIQQQ